MFYVQFTRIDYEDYCWTDMPILFKTEKDAEKYLNKEIFRRMNVIFRYYVDNPNICELLILKDKRDDKHIIGRALIWKLTNGKYYMDRVYISRLSDELSFMRHAKEQLDIHLNFKNYRVPDIINELRINVNKIYDKYPYMDTFVYKDPESLILYNIDYSTANFKRYFTLDHQDGKYREYIRKIS